MTIKTKNKYIKILSVINIVIILCSNIRVSADNNGYIVKFESGYSPPSNINIKQSDLSENIYWIDNVEKAQNISSKIEYIESNDEVSLIDGTITPTFQPFSIDAPTTQGWFIPFVNADYAWSLATYGNDINIAIIDSGCNQHEDIKDNLAGGYNYIDNSLDYSDNIGHGTHIAGIIAAQHNQIGIDGVAPKANIYALKCFDKYASSTSLMLATAIKDAVDKYNCQIINMSLGLLSDKQTIYDAVKYATDKGAIIVAAVGNDGTESKYYPASYDEVIGVGSVNADYEKSDFSQMNNSVYIVAPGENINSLSGTDAYVTMEGTSQAAPIVSATIAVALSANNELTPSIIKEHLKNSSYDLGTTGYDEYFGYGLIDAKKFFELCLQNIKYYISPINKDEIVVYNNTSNPLTSVGIFAEYLNGRMLNVKTYDVNVTPYDKVKILNNTQNSTASFFLWESLETIKPLAKKRMGGNVK